VKKGQTSASNGLAPLPAEASPEGVGKRGREAAELLPLVYQELRRLAHHRLAGERRSQLLQTTALVHEAYLRLEHNGHTRWENRGHFFAAAATAMRRILVERARRRRQLKRGAGHHPVELEEAAVVAGPRSIDMLALDEALKKLAGNDAQAAQVVNLRYFAGLSIEETADALDMSPRSVKRAWTYARAWLQVEMTQTVSRE
jgi:RNA polymerase sigma factor (TIGR02999 family)